MWTNMLMTAMNLFMDSLCKLGNRLLQLDGSGNCTKERGSPLYEQFCVVQNEFDGGVCDDYFMRHNVSKVQGIKGMSSGVFYDNLWPYWMEKVCDCDHDGNLRRNV